MQRFNLNTWLQDKSRKVIDDDGFPVEIIKWDANEKYPVVCLNHNGFAYNVSVDGMYDSDPNHGLFFADDEEELTEFEKAIYLDICTIVTACDGKVYGDKELKPIVKGFAKDLLDLARKKDWREHVRAYKNGYEQGKQDALKDLPKWKRSNSFFNTGNKFELGKTSLRRFDGYEIPYSELEKLSKEE